MIAGAHTPLPWNAPREAWEDRRDTLFWHVDVVSGGLRIAKVAGTSKEKAEANAALIVRAVNNHAALVATLKDVLNRIENSEAWWMDSPEKGGFDAEAIGALLAAVEA